MVKKTLQLIAFIVGAVTGAIAAGVFVQIIDSACTLLGIRGEPTGATVGYAFNIHHEHDNRARVIGFLITAIACLALVTWRRKLEALPGFLYGFLFIGIVWLVTLIAA